MLQWWLMHFFNSTVMWWSESGTWTDSEQEDVWCISFMSPDQCQQASWHHLHHFTFGWPELNGGDLLPLTPSPHLPLVAPYLHVHVSEPLPQDIVLLLALLPLLLHLRAQRRVAIVHQFADLRHRGIGQDLYDRGDLRLEADTVRHHHRLLYLCVPARADVRGGRLLRGGGQQMRPLMCDWRHATSAESASPCLPIIMCCSTMLWLYEVRESLPDDVSLLFGIAEQSAEWKSVILLQFHYLSNTFLLRNQE